MPLRGTTKDENGTTETLKRLISLKTFQCPQCLSDSSVWARPAPEGVLIPRCECGTILGGEAIVKSERHTSSWTCRKKSLVLLGLLLLSPLLCCANLWTASYLMGTNEFYFLATGRYYADLVEERISEYDRLNDELLADLPVYPGAVLIPGTEIKGGPGIPALGTGPAGPRYLEVCYMVDAPVSDVMDFYKRELESQDWNLVKSGNGRIITLDFTKGDACAEVTNDCACVTAEIVPNACPSAVYDSEIYPVAYKVDVYHDLNKLLGFPGLPDGGCP